jgi:response regulator of citrate/malate metabolism
VSTSFIKVFIRIVLCIYLSAPKGIDILPRLVLAYKTTAVMGVIRSATPLNVIQKVFQGGMASQAHYK